MALPEISQTVSPAAETNLERRSADSMVLRFGESALKAFMPAHATFSDEDLVETIDMDSMLPPGLGNEDFHSASAKASTPAPGPDQSRIRLQIVKFKQTFDNYECHKTTIVTIDHIKRGDIVEIKSIVGSIFIRILDRIRGERAGTGEILCECRYDLPDKWTLVHTATILLPVCAKNHVILQPDGTRRFASRMVKMKTDAELPDHVRSVLHESFFTEIIVHATPEPEKARMVDVARWFIRHFLKVKTALLKPGREKQATMQPDPQNNPEGK